MARQCKKPPCELSGQRERLFKNHRGAGTAMNLAKKPQFKTRPLSPQGFMLLEIALVLMLVAVILGPILHLIAGQRSKSAVLEELESRQKITEAVEGYVLATGRLPCPATTPNGTEARTANTCL